MKSLSILISLSGVLFSFPWTSTMGQSTTPDLIFYNGTVITMEADQPQTEALAVQGETILAIGSNDEILALQGPTTQVVDFQGRTLMPGFNDSHAHWIGDRDIAGYSTPEETIQAALENGWTSISELFVNQERLDELQALDRDGRLRLRVNAYLPINFMDEKFGNWYLDYQPGV